MVKTVVTAKLMGDPIYENRFFVKGARLIYQNNSGKLNCSSARLSAEYPLQVLQRIPEVIDGWETRKEDNRVRIEQLSSILTLTWGKEKELMKLRTDLTLLDRKIEKELRENETPHQPVKVAA